MLTFSSCWVRGWTSASWSTLSTWESGLIPHAFLGASTSSTPICITSPTVCSESLEREREWEKMGLKWIHNGHIKLSCVLSQGEGNSPMVLMHVSSRVCWASERTRGTPASHFFLSPPDDGLSSGDTEMAGDKTSCKTFHIRLFKQKH